MDLAPVSSSPLTRCSLSLSFLVNWPSALTSGPPALPGLVNKSQVSVLILESEEEEQLDTRQAENMAECRDVVE